MSKRKQSTNGESDSDSSDVNLIDVDFDFFDPNPIVDYAAIKRLLIQLFQSDADGLALHELTELILSQPTVGTTIKTDGIESDPYAILTVLNMHVHRDHPSIKAITQYALEKTSQETSFHNTLRTLLSPNQTEHHVGLVICERLINMPVQVIPPMYKMLGNEVKWAIDDGELYSFTHLLFISRTYHLSLEEESALASNQAQNQTSSKRAKKPKSQRGRTQPQGQGPPDGIYSFHPEDDVIMQHATHTLNYTLTHASSAPRDKESFGLDIRGRIMLVQADRFESLVSKMEEVYQV